MQRCHYCNLRPIDATLTEAPLDSLDSLIQKTLTLNGWIKKIRRHGTISFINLRDRHGEVQLTIDIEQIPTMESMLESLRIEFCIAVQGILQWRPKNMQNPSMSTGMVELFVHQLEILSSCAPLPFMLYKEPQEGSVGESDGNEALRLKYRYLDLRSEGMQKRIILRHKLNHEIHNFLHQKNFLEIETPTLIRSMPEGARDYLVPSRIHTGQFYALPQSPQLYKQLLMIGGLDRYYQIARCYRDEDARGDRQPEFTQLDLEMSFVQGKDVRLLIEKLMACIWQKVLDQKLNLPFICLNYEEAMNRYGSDKPDLRNPLELKDFSNFAQKSNFTVFQECLNKNGTIKVLIVPQGTEYCSRKVITELEVEAKKYGAKGLAWMRTGHEGFEGGIGRFFQEQFNEISRQFSVQPGDILFFVADCWDIACTALGAIRKQLGKALNLIEPETFAFAWVINFPLFCQKAPTEHPTDSIDNNIEPNNTNWTAAHHMFCMPLPEYVETMEQNPGTVRGDIYDLILNGYELGSGSIRIHRADIQAKIFDIVGYSKELAEERFGFMLEAFRYGAPPHGGIALGLDRLAMILAGKESIKEVIAFPKNNLGQSLLDHSPGSIPTSQLAELKLSSSNS